MSTYSPVVGSNDTFELAATSTNNMQALDHLKIRAAFLNEQDDIAQNYGYDSAEAFLEDRDLSVVTPPEFWDEAAGVVFEDLDPEGKEIDFAEVRRAVADFTMSGNEAFSELLNGLRDSETTSPA